MAMDHAFEVLDARGARASADELLEARNTASLAMLEVCAVLKEMRSRKVNHGRSTSPTLIAWANRLDAAIEVFRGDPT